MSSRGRTWASNSLTPLGRGATVYHMHLHQSSTKAIFSSKSARSGSHETLEPKMLGSVALEDPKLEKPTE